MKKIKFYLGTGYAGCSHEEVVEYEDNVTEEEIEVDFESWKNEHIDASWWQMED